MTIQNRKPKNLQELAIDEFDTLGTWLREPITIFKNSKQEVWIRNEGGFCTMQAMMQYGKKLTSRKYTAKLVIGFYDPGVESWVESPHLEAKYPVWVQETKQKWGVAR